MDVPSVPVVPIVPSVPVLTVIPGRGLDAHTFLLVQCDNKATKFAKKDLYAAADEFNVSYDDHDDFTGLCRRVQTAIISKKLEEARGKERLIAPLTTEVFDRKTCQEIQEEYSLDDIRKFAASSKSDLGPWYDTIQLTLNTGKSPKIIAPACQLIHFALRAKNVDASEEEVGKNSGLVRGTPEEEVMISDFKLSKQLAAESNIRDAIAAKEAQLARLSRSSS
jgi:hypothetical protein